MNVIKTIWRMVIHPLFAKNKYTYGFSYLGLPILKMPQDIQALQEIIWELKPDIIIETGVAGGGSVIFFSAMLELLGKGKVIGIEINLYPENRKKILAHPLSKNVILLDGSSTDKKIIDLVHKCCENKKVLVCLDSNHTHDHVLSELRAYSHIADYIVVDDTGLEDLPNDNSNDRPWGKGNNPKTAVLQFLNEGAGFEIDKEIEEKIIFTGSSDGYLRRIK